jgi:hypothetical protein
MSTEHRARGVLKINNNRTTSVVGRANAMCTGIDDNSSQFSNPPIPTSAVQAQVVVVNKCEVVAATRAHGAAAARNVQRTTLVGMMVTDLAYIQGVADKCVTWEQSVATLLAGGVLVAVVPIHVKGILEIKQGPTPGSVTLDANLGMLTAGLKGKFFFNWESTLDSKSFVTLPSTPNHLTVVSNLTPLTSYGFRVSVTNAAGVLQPWSQVVYFLVH